MAYTYVYQYEYKAQLEESEKKHNEILELAKKTFEGKLKKLKLIKDSSTRNKIEITLFDQVPNSQLRNFGKKFKATVSQELTGLKRIDEDYIILFYKMDDNRDDNRYAELIRKKDIDEWRNSENEVEDSIDYYFVREKTNLRIEKIKKKKIDFWNISNVLRVEISEDLYKLINKQQIRLERSNEYVEIGVISVSIQSEVRSKNKDCFLSIIDPLEINYKYSQEKGDNYTLKFLYSKKIEVEDVKTLTSLMEVNVFNNTTKNNSKNTVTVNTQSLELTVHNVGLGLLVSIKNQNNDFPHIYFDLGGNKQPDNFYINHILTNDTRIFISHFHDDHFRQWNNFHVKGSPVWYMPAQKETAAWKKASVQLRNRGDKVMLLKSFNCSNINVYSSKNTTSNDVHKSGNFMVIDGYIEELDKKGSILICGDQEYKYITSTRNIDDIDVLVATHHGLSCGDVSYIPKCSGGSHCIIYSCKPNDRYGYLTFQGDHQKKGWTTEHITDINGDYTIHIR